MQKMWCWICDNCRVIIEYGTAPTEHPHYCKKCKEGHYKLSDKDFAALLKDLELDEESE